MGFEDQVIVDPDFVDHWKTRMLVGLLGDDELAPIYVIRLWAHCQNRKAWTFVLSPGALKGICRFSGDAELFERSMAECGFVVRDGEQIEVAGWAEYNASLIAAWSNGSKGGRPRKVKNEDSENLRDNPQETHGVTDKRREERIREENPPTKEAYRQASEVGGAIDVGNGASPVSRAIEIAVYLRQRGITGANSINPNIAAWGDDVRVTNEILDAALSIVASRKLAKAPGPNYLAGIIADLLAPKPAKSAVKADDWHRSEAGIKRKARELGFGDGRANETWDSLKARCWDEIARLKREGVAA